MLSLQLGGTIFDLLPLAEWEVTKVLTVGSKHRSLCLYKAEIFMTGDNHGDSGMGRESARLNSYIDASDPGCIARFASGEKSGIKMKD